ncbi:hypothetical protein [Algibacter lectus]|nr:hypothetical protein [Algibacter lectus]
MGGTSTDSIYAIQHGGGINGFNTNILRTPSDKSLIVLLNNTGGAPLSNITNAILGIINNKTYSMPKKSVADAMLTVIEAKGIDAGITHYNEIKDSELYNLEESDLNAMGYQLMGGLTI